MFSFLISIETTAATVTKAVNQAVIHIYSVAAMLANCVQDNGEDNGRPHYISDNWPEKQSRS
jgi:hypothetical protein